MSARGGGPAALVAAAMALAACGGAPCEPLAVVPAMSAARARVLAPGLETGLGVSTALDLGACPADPSEVLRCANRTPSCGLLRRSRRFLVVPALGSLPLDPSCPSGFRLDALAPRASLDARTSDAGEWAGALEPGFYVVIGATSADGCGACGAVGAGAGCQVEVRPGRITTRALVLRSG